MHWLKRLVSRNRRYDDLAISIQEHLDERAEELMEDGLSREEAAQKARREFGNVTVIAERSREAWQWPTLESIWADVKFAALRLGRSPGFAATVVLTLAIGIGANTAVFSVLNSVLIKPLPYPKAEELVGVRLIAPGAAGLANFSDGLRLSPSMYFTYAEHNRTFQSLGVWTTGTANVTGLAEPEQVHTALISDGVLQALSVPPTVGRWLMQPDQNPRGRKAVMLSYGYWQRRFGGQRSAIGRSIAIDSQPREIVGVMPQGFRLANADSICLCRSPSIAINKFWLGSAIRASLGSSREPRSRKPTRISRVCCRSGWTPGPTAPGPIRTFTRSGKSRRLFGP
jgi:hypothetical protein